MPSFRSAFVFTAVALAAFTSAAPTVTGGNGVVTRANNAASPVVNTVHDIRSDCTTCHTLVGIAAWADVKVDAQAALVKANIDAKVAAQAIVNLKAIVVDAIAHVDALVDVNVDVKVSVVVDLIVKIVAQINAIVAACVKANVSVDVTAVVALVAQLLAKVTVHVSATVKADICAQVVAAVKAILGLQINVDAIVNVATSAAHAAAPTL